MEKYKRELQWLEHFMTIAKTVSTMSKDPSRKIGAVIVDKNKRIISTGFNGFAKGIVDSEERLQDKEMKRILMLHAEENAILHAKQDLTDCSIFVYGYPPCVHCMSLIIQSGIKLVYYRNSSDLNAVSQFWKDNLELSLKLAEEASVAVIDI